MNRYFQTVLQVRCPVCRRSSGHWCRDDKGKSMALPHRERSQAALDVVMSPLGPRRAGAPRKTQIA